MTLKLPNLDDRRWSDLVEESRALIPVYGREWTDHNVHDPGITVIELLAYVAEMDLFQLNQIPDTHKRKFLALIGLRPEPPRAAHVVMKFGLDAAMPSLELPAGLAFTTPAGEPIRFELQEAISVVAGDIGALQFWDGKAFQDLTHAWRRGEPINAFGPNPQSGAAFYVGFSAALPAGKPARLHFRFSGEKSSQRERERIEKEMAERTQDCQPPIDQNPCVPAVARPAAPAVTPVPSPPLELVHPSVRTVWEFWADSGAQGQWEALRPVEDQLLDGTRSFTLDGKVSFQLPSAMIGQVFGSVPRKLFYLRNRILSGAYDAAPSITGAVFNAAPAIQATPLTSSLRIAPGAQIQGKVPNPGDTVRLTLQLDTAGRVNRLNFAGGSAGDPKFLVLAYRAPTSDEGLLQMEAAFLGRTSGLPFDSFLLPNLPVLTSEFDLFSLSASGWQRWQWRDDLESSSSRDTDVVLDPTTGKITFGDGKNGLLPDAGSLLFVQTNSSVVKAGNVAANAVSLLEDSPHNRALLGANWAGVSGHLKTINNPFAAEGGASAETLDQTSLRAFRHVHAPTRAVTLSDYQQFALNTPGVRMARAMAVSDFHDHFPCFQAPGIVTVVVVPFLPVGAPTPSRASRRAIAAYLNRRRIIGTRIRVIAPEYVEVSLRAQVKAQKGADRTVVRTRIVRRLEQFLDPLKGGEDGTGWAFGRHVYAPDLLAAIAEVPGVDHVQGFAFTSGGCTPPCDKICVPPTGLVEAGTLSVEVV